MRLRGILLVVAVLLTTAACTEKSAAPVELAPGEIPECVGCDDAVTTAAMDNPVVAQAKLAPTTPTCDVLPPHSIGVIVGAPAKPGMPEEPGMLPEDCHAEFLSGDGSRRGEVWLRYTAPDSVDTANIVDYQGNTWFEAETMDGTACDAGVAIDDTKKRDEHGSWLTVRVTSENGDPAACVVGAQMLIVAFDNLPDA